MCGIAGLFRAKGELPEGSMSRLKDALATIAYRGPDAEGIAERPGLALGHRRLSILDLNERANQPMPSRDGAALLSYNGEIYNFHALKTELEQAGRRFATTSDTEVLLEGYQAWGIEGLLGRAAGMFAFALYDSNRAVLILARDRAGKKPLYYCEQDGTLAFGSEMRALLALLPKRPQILKDGLDAFLELKFVPSPFSLFEGVYKLPAGCYQEFGGGASEFKRFWSPLGKKIAPASWLDAIEERLTVAVKRRLVSDVPVCLFLSGGIDSSLIGERLSAAGASGTVAYTIGYDDMPGYSEFEFARMAAKDRPIELRELHVKSTDALAALRDESLEPDDPISDWVWVPLHLLSKQARADGFKVVLLGEGSDELFFGYDVMLKGLRHIEHFKSPLMRGLARAAAVATKPVYNISRKGHRRYDLWRRAGAGAPPYWGSSIGFPRSQRHQIVGPRLGGPGEDPAEYFIRSLYERFGTEAVDSTDRVNLVCFVEFLTKMNEVLLQRVDRVTMKHSLEARAPFLDHELVELAFAIPGRDKIPGRRLKELLKELARKRLPAAIVDRPKMGFSFPFKEWLRGPLGPIVESTLMNSKLFSDGWLNREFCLSMLAEHRRGRVDHAPRVWQLYSLARWYDRWAV